MTMPTFEEITTDKPYKPLTEKMVRGSGRNNQGKITVRHRGDEHVSNYTVAQDAYGNADDCIRYVTRLKEAGADEVLFLFQMGTIPHAAIMETIRNVGEKVIPHFRRAGVGQVA